MRERVGIGRVGSEIDTVTICARVRKADVKAVLTGVDHFRIGLVTAMEQMLHYISDLLIRVLPEHPLEFVHELLVEYAVV